MTVSVARENFMEKLKREREESTQSPLSKAKTDVVVTANPFRFNVEKTAKVIRTFSSDDEESVGNGTAEPDTVVKRKSKLFTENGKVGNALNGNYFCLSH